MAEYIDRTAAMREIDHARTLNSAYLYVATLPAADVVPKAAYDQVAWERDIAIQQLRDDYGVGLGEKKSDDVVEVKHGRWTEKEHIMYDSMREEYVYWYAYICSECDGEAMNNYLYCPNCGAKMDGEI